MSLLLGRKFLVVDDDNFMREVVNEIFTNYGATVTEAENGVEAFLLVKKTDYDVVFTDMRMPGGDGIALAKNISELSGKKPMVFVCSGFNDVAIEKIKELNIQKVYEKPFDYALIVKEISDLLSNIG